MHFASLRAGSLRTVPSCHQEKQGHICPDIHGPGLIILHLFVQGPHLRCLAAGLPRDLFYDPALVGNDLFQQADVALHPHVFVSVSPHPT